MPSKEDPTKNRTGGAKQSGNGQEPTDESGRSTRSTAKSAEAQRTALATSDGGQVQPAVAEFSAKTMAEDVGKTSHGAPPANEARARTSTEGSQDAEMEDTTVKDKAMSSSWSKAKKQFQPKLNACLNRLVDSIPNDPEDSGEEDTGPS
ncbi:hypothetical protein AAVH_25915 [Aphelenchoides avenae]|nr:hypothetical protein AAVH_25915 [Aphelenchus avenae]